MVVIEFILSLLGRIFIDIIFKEIIIGFIRLLRKVYDFIKINILGFSKTKELVNPIKKLEKLLLYKEFELRENLNSTFKVGQKGTILEIIDEDRVFAEFYDANGSRIEFDNQLVFEIKMSQFNLKDKHNKA